MKAVVDVSDKQIIIRNSHSESVVVFDITERILFSVPTVLNIEIPINQPGVYIVRNGNELSKVMLK